MTHKYTLMVNSRPVLSHTDQAAFLSRAASWLGTTMDFWPECLIRTNIPLDSEVGYEPIVTDRRAEFTIFILKDGVMLSPETVQNYRSNLCKT